MAASTMLRPLALASLGLVLAACGTQSVPLAPAGSPAAAAIQIDPRQPCAEATARALAGLGLEPAAVRSISIDTERINGESGGSRVTGYRAWVRLVEQPGYLVVVFNRQCVPGSAYTQGGAQVAGV